MKELLVRIKKCDICKAHLPHGVNPVVTAAATSKIIIVGQAPGRVVHKSGIPWDDKSGDNLRRWLNIDKEAFYDTSKIAIIPMGFCYPGTGKSGDLPPRKECAPQWHPLLLQGMEEVEMILLIGKYAQNYYLPEVKRMSLTKTVFQFQNYLPKFFVLPHPSPRNNIWQAKNPWFKEDVLPVLEYEVRKILKP